MDLSVVIPAYNVERWIEMTLASVLEQPVTDLEIIVVDDGSTDGTAAKARSVSPKVRVLAQENRGQGAARNYGAREATGDNLLFLDADDLLLPGCVPSLRNALDRWPGAGAVNPRFDVLQIDGLVTPGPQRRDDYYGRAQLRDVLLGNPFGGNMLLRRHVWETHPFPEEDKLRFCEDLTLWVHLLLDGIEIVIPPETSIRRREGRPGAATTQLWAMRRDRNHLFRRLLAEPRLTRTERTVVRFGLVKTGLGMWFARPS